MSDVYADALRLFKTLNPEFAAKDGERVTLVAALVAPSDDYRAMLVSRRVAQVLEEALMQIAVMGGSFVVSGESEAFISASEVARRALETAAKVRSTAANGSVPRTREAPKGSGT